ncbi:hypothetical protein LPJ61_003943 [Coemansia biformis]|uniref:DUF788-domain-containing protein n=1 Tax=Coemansia biformis TaxID=1286918 RepID=A0A9W8CX85_9FUNG|nr:hypothetical protein LPJ61_003943 [Coemansia biformis]
MANQSAKRISQSNAARLAALSKGALAVNSVYLVVRVLFQRGSLSWTEAMLYLATTVIEVLVIRNFHSMAQPRYDGGVLVDAGADLSSSGLTSYLFDYVYISWLAHLLSLATKWAWALYLVIPAYAAYYLLPYVRQFLLPKRADESSAAATAADEAKEKKRREKKERQRQRVKYVRA